MFSRFKRKSSNTNTDSTHTTSFKKYYQTLTNEEREALDNVQANATVLERDRFRLYGQQEPLSGELFYVKELHTRLIHVRVSDSGFATTVGIYGDDILEELFGSEHIDEVFGAIYTNNYLQEDGAYLETSEDWLTYYRRVKQTDEQEFKGIKKAIT